MHEPVVHLYLPLDEAIERVRKEAEVSCFGNDLTKELD